MAIANASRNYISSTPPFFFTWPQSATTLEHKHPGDKGYIFTRNVGIQLYEPVSRHSGYQNLKFMTQRCSTISKHLRITKYCQKYETHILTFIPPRHMDVCQTKCVCAFSFYLRRQYAGSHLSNIIAERILYLNSLSVSYHITHMKEAKTRQAMYV